jgi:hypothetical protein
MKTLRQYLDEKGRCWTGYKPVAGKKAFSKGSCEPVSEDGGAMGGGVSVAAIAGSGDSRLPASQREPGVSKKHNPVMRGLGKRNPPKM